MKLPQLSSRARTALGGVCFGYYGVLAFYFLATTEATAVNSLFHLEAGIAGGLFIAIGVLHVVQAIYEDVTIVTGVLSSRQLAVLVVAAVFCTMFVMYYEPLI